MRTQRRTSSGDQGAERKENPTGHIGGHISVLLHEVLEALPLHRDSIVLDGTLGGAGHAAALIEKLGPEGIFIGFDSDREAIGRAHQRLTGMKPHLHLVQGNFSQAATTLEELGIKKCDAMLFDLGWSTYQLERGRGFSFREDEPLLMTYGDPELAVFTARDVVNDWEEEHIADVLYHYADETAARRIARALVENRSRKPIETSLQLAEIVRAAVPLPMRFGRTHPATKTFQALRIVVNDELGAVRAALALARTHLAPGGRIAFITFHSIEDRIVKIGLSDMVKEGLGTLVYKKPLGPAAEELSHNPRARSAKLRVFQYNNHAHT
jgi:16S rRNA (cytosine1402-N4)-methyltransferase